MKNIARIVLPFVLALTIGSCSDENEEARTPLASVTINADKLEINQSMEIRFNGIADQVVVYTGDNGHDYDLRQESNTGFVMNKGIFTYSYAIPGTFKVVCVATTYDTYLGSNMKTDVSEFIVTVIDDQTTIEKVYSSITPNVYYAEAVDEENWVLRLPTKQVYNNREIALNAKKQRLSFEIASDSSKIYVDGELFAVKNYYDLTVPHDIHVVSDAGTTRDYKLHTMIFPEFKNLSINGVNAKLQRNAFYQDLLTYNVELPAGSDVGNVTPQFAVDDNVKFYADGVEINQGMPIDLTNDNTEYTLVSTHPDYNNISATSNVVINITYK